MLRSIIISLLLLACWTGGNSQAYDLMEVEVKHGDETLSIALAGGLRAPQFNTMDLDLDGTQDIVVFDREGDIIIPLVRNEDESYSYKPSFRSIFPSLRQWMRLVDYNGDGVKDIFCSPISIGIPGVEVYKGVVTDGVLGFQQVLFPDNTSDILFYPLGNSDSQVFVSPADQPEIKDIDGDGDIDILAFEPSGGTVFYYKNLTVEEDLDPDLFKMELEDQCYGGFIESGFSQDVTLSPSPGDCANFFREPDDIRAQTRHSGSTVTIEDVTGDGLNEALLGDIAYNGIVQLENGGSEGLAWMTGQEIRFPQASDSPITIELFLASFFEDVDQDGTKEFIATTNDRSGAQGMNHIWLYDRVTEEGEKDQFLLQTRNYLVEDMIYTGTMSAPLFFDYNNDDLQDLLIGTSGRSPDGISNDPRMILYENQGSPEAPVFVLADNDYLDMNEFESTSSHFAPAIGDIDGDGDKDMVIGDNRGRLYYISNGSNDPNVYSFRRPIFQPWGIQVSAWAKPFIYDYNKDGLGDLVIGEQNFNSVSDSRGSFNYFENQGTVGNPVFIPDETQSPNQAIWGNAFMKEAGFISNFSAPVIADLGDREVLIAGTEKGSVYLYDSIEYGEDVTFELISSFLGEVGEGQISAVTVADIDNDNFLELAVGTRRGGIGIFDTDMKIDVRSATKEVLSLDAFSISPVPADDMVTISLKDRVCDDCLVRMTDSQGKIVIQERFSGSSLRLELTGVPAGLYFSNIEGEDFQVTAKVVIAD